MSVEVEAALQWAREETRRNSYLVGPDKIVRRYPDQNIEQSKLKIQAHLRALLTHIDDLEKELDSVMDDLGYQIAENEMITDQNERLQEIRRKLENEITSLLGSVDNVPGDD